MAKEIILKGGEVALVDDEDYPLLSRYSWQRAGAAGYAVTTIQTITGKRHTIYMHKFIMGGFWICDHINLNPLDNRKENLRRATMQQNGWNKGKPKASRYGAPASQYKGVVRCVAKDGRIYWRVLIKLTKKGEVPARFARLGPFATEIEAARAYNVEVVKHRGEWAWLNPIPSEAA